jgi:hypothetical protein
MCTGKLCVATFVDVAGVLVITEQWETASTMVLDSIYLVVSFQCVTSCFTSSQHLHMCEKWAKNLWQFRHYIQLSN